MGVLIEQEGIKQTNKGIPRNVLHSGLRRSFVEPKDRKCAHVATPHQVECHTPVREMVTSATCWPEPRGSRVFVLLSPPICALTTEQRRSPAGLRPRVFTVMVNVAFRDPGLTGRAKISAGVCGVRGHKSACMLMSTRLRTFSHGGD